MRSLYIVGKQFKPQLIWRWEKRDFNKHTCWRNGNIHVKEQNTLHVHRHGDNRNVMKSTDDNFIRLTGRDEHGGIQGKGRREKEMQE